MDLHDRLDLASKEGTQEVLQILKDFLNGTQSILFSSEDYISDESLRELIGGCKFCVKMLRSIDPEFELSEGFIKQRLLHEAQETMPKPKLADDIETKRGMPGMRPNAF